MRDPLSNVDGQIPTSARREPNHLARWLNNIGLRLEALAQLIGILLSFGEQASGEVRSALVEWIDQFRLTLWILSDTLTKSLPESTEPGWKCSVDVFMKTGDLRNGLLDYLDYAEEWPLSVFQEWEASERPGEMIIEDNKSGTILAKINKPEKYPDTSTRAGHKASFLADLRDAARAVALLLQLLVPEAPAELMARDRWLLWRYEESSSEKPTKVPYPVNGWKGSTTDSRTWSSFRVAINAFKQGGYSGIGFVFSADDEFVGIDLDDCIDENGHIKLWAKKILEKFQSYSEISPSGRGIKIWVRGSLPGGRAVKVSVNKNGMPIAYDNTAEYDGGVEMYERARYFTYTGNQLPGTPFEICDCSAMVASAAVWYKDQLAKTGRTHSSKSSSKQWSVPERIQTGDRHKTFLARAAQMWAQKHTEQQIFDELMDLSATRCVEPKPYVEGEILGILKWVTSFPPGHSDSWDAAYPKQTHSAKQTDFAPPPPPPPSNPGEMPSFLPQDPEPGVKAMKPNDIARMIMRDRSLLVDQNSNLYEYTGKYWRLTDPRLIRSYAMVHDSHTHTNTRRRQQVADYIMDALRHPGDIGWRNLQPTEVPCNNGVVDAVTHELRPHRKEDYLETTIPVDYVPSAQCYTWLKCLDRWFRGDPDKGAKISALQEFGGYVLLPHARYKRALFPYGEGDTGKSVAAQMLGMLVGERNKCVISTKDMDDPQKRAPIVGKMLNILTELPATAMITDGGFKQLVSTGDPIQIDPKHRSGFAYTPFCKHVICANKLPTVNDTTSATFNRILLIHFPNVIPKHEQDPTLIDKLRDELPGILLWCLEGAARLVLHDGEFTQINAAKEMIAEYRAEQNPVNTFIEEMCVVEEMDDLGIQNRIALSEFRLEYVKWNNNKAVEHKYIVERLRSSGFKAGESRKNQNDPQKRKARSVLGLRWKTEDEKNEERAAELREDMEAGHAGH